MYIREVTYSYLTKFLIVDNNALIVTHVGIVYQGTADEYHTISRKVLSCCRSFSICKILFSYGNIHHLYNIAENLFNFEFH